MGGSSGVIPERAEIHVRVALDDAARQGVGGGSGRLTAGPQVNGVTIRVVLRGRGKAGLPEIHLKIRMVWIQSSVQRQRGRAKNGKKSGRS